MSPSSDRRGRRDAAYTLLEVVIALAVFAVIALSMSASVASAMRANLRAQNRDTARAAAAQQMEQVLAWPEFLTLAQTFDGTTFVAGDLAMPDGSVPGRITVTSPLADRRRVDIVVTWFDSTLVGPESDGVQRFEIATVLTDRSSM